MKKLIIILFIISLGFIFKNHNEEIMIPNQAIRFRVIANSSTLDDQLEKMAIKNSVEKEVYDLIGTTDDITDVRNVLENNLDKIKEVIDPYNVPYQVNYGVNYFPSKTYKGIVYGAGNYESLVVTLGEGLGENFWCVLFPPLCLMNEQTDLSDVDYQFYVKKILNKF